MESRSIRVSSAMAYLRRLDVYRMASAIARGRSRTYTPAGASSAVTPLRPPGAFRAPAAGTLVATDDARIADAVRAFGGEVAMTGAHATGTDRVAAVAADLAADVILDVQGDLPRIDPEALAACVAPFADPAVEMASLMTPLRDADEWRSPPVVKGVTDADDFGLYFSRSLRPC